MKHWAAAALKVCWGAYLIVGSLYCFLASVPFTYHFVIVSPPFHWIDVFAQYNLVLLWICVLGSFAASGPQLRLHLPRTMMTAQVGPALVISLCNPIRHAQTAAFAWSIGLLLCLLALSAYDLFQAASTNTQPSPGEQISFPHAVLIGILAGLISCAVLRLHGALKGATVYLVARDVELFFWVVVEHVTVAVVVASVVNLLRWALSRFTRSGAVLGPGVPGLLIFCGLAWGSASFVESSFAVRALTAWTYSVVFAGTLTVWGLGLVTPILCMRKQSAKRRWLLAGTAAVLVVVTSYLPETIGLDDWNGILHVTDTLLLWLILAVSLGRARQAQKTYSTAMILVVAIGVVAAHQGLQVSRSGWAAEIGHNNKQISREMRIYAAQNTSFRMVDTILGNGEDEECNEDCRTLRRYSNLTNARIAHDLTLVDDLTSAKGPRPNIFVIVVDSLRPDYLGVYNPRVDFTPEIDALARDSVVMRRAYANYAGTSLSEPSIWSGALLPHAHYAMPFQSANSLQKLVDCDGYQLVVSYDEVLRQLLPPSKDIVLLDADKDWRAVEISSTLKQLETFLDHRPAGAAPVFFYAQPKNVHMHAINSLPARTSQNWRHRDGFEDRIAYAVQQTDGFLGDFVGYLKRKGLYDNSIIVVTADHGDATGEFGRTSHSLFIYPEIMRVPLIVHLPRAMRSGFVYDENRLSALMDLVPSLYYLLGHRPIRVNPLIGKSIFAATVAELNEYPREDILLASDARAAYGIVSGDGRWLYTIYDAPSRSMLFDLSQDPNALHDVVTPEAHKKYNDRIVQYLQALADFYGNQPTGSTSPFARLH